MNITNEAMSALDCTSSEIEMAIDTLSLLLESYSAEIRCTEYYHSLARYDSSLTTLLVFLRSTQQRASDTFNRLDGERKRAIENVKEEKTA